MNKVIIANTEPNGRFSSDRPLFLPPSPQKKGIYKKPKSPYPTNKSSCKSSSTGATLPAQPSPPPTAQRDSTRASHS